MKEFSMMNIWSSTKDHEPEYSCLRESCTGSTNNPKRLCAKCRGNMKAHGLSREELWAKWKNLTDKNKDLKI